MGTTLLVLSVVALVIPAIFHLIVGGGAGGTERELSLEISFVLMATYLLSLVFTLRTHRYLYAGTPQQAETGLGSDAAPGGAHRPSMARAVECCCWLRWA